jgi:hypothetical protein
LAPLLFWSKSIQLLCYAEEVQPGKVGTRTGRRFFADDALEHQFLSRLQSAADA